MPECPLGLKLLSHPCLLKKCVFNMDEACEYEQMNGLSEEDRRMFLKQHGLLDSAQKAASDLQKLLIADSYITYRVSKTYLNSLAPQEYEKLSDRESYEAWPSSKLLSFNVFLKILNHHRKETRNG